MREEKGNLLRGRRKSGQGGGGEGKVFWGGGTERSEVGEGFCSTTISVLDYQTR